MQFSSDIIVSRTVIATRQVMFQWSLSGVVTGMPRPSSPFFLFFLFFRPPFFFLFGASACRRRRASGIVPAGSSMPLQSAYRFKARLTMFVYCRPILAPAPRLASAQMSPEKTASPSVLAFFKKLIACDCSPVHQEGVLPERKLPKSAYRRPSRVLSWKSAQLMVFWWSLSINLSLFYLFCLLSFYAQQRRRACKSQKASFFQIFFFKNYLFRNIDL